MNFIVSGLLSYNNIYFSFILLSSNQTLCFLSLLSGSDRQDTKMETCQGGCSVFFLPTLDACRIVIWVLPSLGSGLLCTCNPKPTLSSPSSCWHLLQHSVWDLLPETTSTLVYCLLNIMRVLKPTQMCCLTHHPCLSTHHVQAILTT